MAITYILGIPRSGKSYLAVYKIYEFFIKKHKKNKEIKHNYKFCYTNINEFKFEVDNRIKKLEFDDFKSKLNELYEAYYINKFDDTILNELASKLEINYSLIVIDEAHNFLTSKEDNVLKWWLTYHGHLYQDIYLITQDLSLISTGYKSLAEFFYKAVEPAKRLFVNKFRYVQYSSYKMYQTTLIKGGGFTLKALNEVFSLYHSGAKNDAKSIVVKYFIVAIIFTLLTLFSFIFFISSFKSDNPKKSKANINTLVSNNLNFNNLHFYKIYCFVDRCKINDNYLDFSYKYLKFILNNSPPVYFESYNKSINIFEFVLGFKEPVFKNLKKEDNIEKVNNFNMFNNKL